MTSMIPPSFSLAGKVALITGGNGGIGLGMAEGLADAGATIIIAARNIEKSRAAATGLAKRGIKTGDIKTGNIKTGDIKTGVIAVDVADAASCKAMVDEAVRQFGRVDILINNAGINIRKQPEQLTPAEWRDVLSINLDGAFYCAQAVHPVMAKAGGGKIINIGSMLSIFGTSFATAYAASKGGIVQMTKSLAIAWAKDNIQVNAVLPGWIDTELTQKARVEVDGLHDRVLSRTPAARWGTPADFRGIATFLASPAADFVTGTAIPVDGGFSIQG
jgi:2-dehydro-3-deoxy-D-gluconate 5-dehydrogenase